MTSRHSPLSLCQALGVGTRDFTKGHVPVCDCLSKVTGPLSAATLMTSGSEPHALTVPEPALPSTSWADLLVLSTGNKLGFWGAALPRGHWGPFQRLAVCQVDRRTSVMSSCALRGNLASPPSQTGSL